MSSQRKRRKGKKKRADKPVAHGDAPEERPPEPEPEPEPQPEPEPEPDRVAEIVPGGADDSPRSGTISAAVTSTAAPRSGVGEAESSAKRSAAGGVSKRTTSDPKRPRPKRSAVPSFLRHLHPPVVDAWSLRPFTTLGLGHLSLFLALILAITGVLLMVYYVPSASGAYGSIQDIDAVVPFGSLVRNMHRWAGHAMVLVVGLHLLRTLVTGAYRDAHASVWTAGVWLFLLTLAFAFTGYLLPWDQLSYWAVSIGGHLAANVPLIGDWLSRVLLGGDQVTGTTLVRFYALHVGILPVATTALVALHLYRLRRANGLVKPREHTRRTEPPWPRMYERELALLGILLAALLVAALLFDAPLGREPDVANPANPSKAPWYFLSIQELVSYSTLLGGVLLPLGALVLLYLVPRIDRDTAGQGRWFGPSGGGIAFLAGAVCAVVAVPGALVLRQAGAGSAGIDPAGALALLTAAVAAIIYWRWRSARMAVLAVAGAAATALAILTFVGLFMRGHSWALVSPWGGG